MHSRLTLVVVCLFLLPAAQGIGISIHGSLPSAVLHNIETMAGLDPAENINVLRESLRDVSNFAEQLMSPAFESEQRRNGISEVSKPSGSTFHELKLRPRFEIQDTKEGFMVIGTLPGLRKEDLSLEILENQEGRFLEIGGGSPQKNSRSPSPAREETTKSHTPKLRAGYAKFERRIRLPHHVDASTLQAKYEDGLLVVTIHPLAKQDSSQRQKITIS